MPPESLDFEEPVSILNKEIEALRLLPSTPERRSTLARPIPSVIMTRSTSVGRGASETSDAESRTRDVKLSREGARDPMTDQ